MTDQELDIRLTRLERLMSRFEDMVVPERRKKKEQVSDKKQKSKIHFRNKILKRA